MASQSISGLPNKKDPAVALVHGGGYTGWLGDMVTDYKERNENEMLEKQIDEEVMNYIKKAAKILLKILQEICKAIKYCFRKWIEFLLWIPKHKRTNLQNMCILVGAKIAGVSNNWRKMHCIPMLRRC